MLHSLTTLGLSFQTLIVDILNLKKPQIQFPLLLFYLISSFMFTAKLGGRCRDFSIYTLYPPGITSAIDTHHRGVHLLQLTNL